MDIQLGDGLSLFIFQKVTVHCPVIFCTAYQHYAIEAFKKNGISYLLKPFSNDALGEAFEKYEMLKTYYSAELSSALTNLTLALSKQVRTYKTTILVEFKGKIIPVAANSIVLAYLAGNQTRLVTLSGEFEIAKKMESLEKEFDPAMFFRANRQFIIAFPYIQEVRHHISRKLEVIMNGFTEQPIIISKEKATAFRKWLDSR